MNVKLLRKTWAGALALLGLAAASLCGSESVTVGLNGNAYVTSGTGGAKIKNQASSGVSEWKSADAVVSVFFSVQQPRKAVSLALNARGNAEYEISVGNKKFNVAVASDDFTRVPVGVVDFDKPGYQRVDIRPVAKGGDDFGEILDLVLDGISGNEMNFVRDFSPYWGRRGPSVHLSYRVPPVIDTEYFYNEMFVPEGKDPVGTFYMACGFGEGYFGAQVNSEKERRILFSVWSPFSTDSPKDVPEEFRVVLKNKGDGVKTGEFGNEGTGGQSYLVYPWRAGTLYKFLVRVHPLENGMTEYSGFFFDPDAGQWRILATFQRPKTQTWLRNPNSFLESFNPDFGWRFRCVGYTNQWLRDKSGEWHQITGATFSCDETGRKGMRLDYAGGLSDNKKFFMLANCGFFDKSTPCYTYFSREPSSLPPEIDFAVIEALASES